MKDKTKKFIEGLRAIVLLPILVCDAYADAYVMALGFGFRAVGLNKAR